MKVSRLGMFRLKGCVKCGGDLFLEGADWECLQCGKYYYTGAPLHFDGRREGAWASRGRTTNRRAGLEARSPER